MDVLGKLSFLDLPDVNTDPVLIADGGGVVSFSGGTTGARPAAGIVGRVYLDTTTNRLYYDDGAVWIDTTQVPLIDGTTDQITVVDGTNVTPAIVSLADNPILPGTARVRLPAGTTAQRPVSPVAGDARFNTTTGFSEEYNGSYWSPMGRVLQIVTGSVPATSGTSQVPFDNTAPTDTEGTQLWSTSFTPVSATSRVVILQTITVAHGTLARTIISSIFVGSTNIGSSAVHVPTGATTQNLPFQLSNNVAWTPGSTSTVTISCRVGASGTGTWYVNQTSAATLGGALVSEYVIMEIA